MPGASGLAAANQRVLLRTEACVANRFLEYVETISNLPVHAAPYEKDIVGSLRKFSKASAKEIPSGSVSLAAISGSVWGEGGMSR